MTGFSIADWTQSDGWDDYVAAHPNGSIFHTRGMVSAMAETKNHRPLAIAARDEGGELRAMLVAIRVATLGDWIGRFGARSILYAEPLCEDSTAGRQALTKLVEHHDRKFGNKVLFTEVRPLTQCKVATQTMVACGYEDLGYYNYLLSLEQDTDAIFAGFIPKNRTNIRRSERRGLTVRVASQPLSELDQFYSLIEISYARSQVPLADKSLFQSVFRRLPPDHFRLTFAEYEGQTIATACFLMYGGRVLHWYGGGARVKGIAANACLLWEMMRWAVDKGCGLFDFGGRVGPARTTVRASSNRNSEVS